MSCACAGSSESPPGSTSGVNATVGVSSFGGNVRVPRNPCGPPTCPQPPTSDLPVVAPYCPTWVRQLTPEATGKLLITIDDCLHILKSQCSGMVHYSADTERASIIDPPYVSSIPQENNYGFLAKVVPTLHKVCVDGSTECVDEVRQELAAQPMGEAECGELVVANPPLCGELASAQAADAAKQVRLDYLKTTLHEDMGCPANVRFLVQTEGTRGSGINRVACKVWSLMRRLVLRASQWNFIQKEDVATAKTAKRVVVVPVEGGAQNDPCYELRVLEQDNQGIPTPTENCKSLIYRGVGTSEEGWKAENLGVRKFYLDTPQVLVRGTNVNLNRYDELKAGACNKIRAIVRGSCFVAMSGSGAGGSGSLVANSTTVAAGYCPIAGGFFLFTNDVVVPLGSNQLLISLVLSTGPSAVVISAENYYLVGYELD